MATRGIQWVKAVKEEVFVHFCPERPVSLQENPMILTWTWFLLLFLQVRSQEVQPGPTGPAGPEREPGGHSGPGQHDQRRPQTLSGGKTDRNKPQQESFILKTKFQ